ncbi:hypothetical protein ADUPG1_014331 [Aduncisulcus paluster]|uniref:Uncharacterized protein n=1 Tax=Aduncisulcus paluster TaxID=2918883 RepID=A0ABQ5KCD5_9EUKA|nr:hypothetical protein ADUPG1_014331 [Aduncisulcus paluster]
MELVSPFENAANAVISLSNIDYASLFDIASVCSKTHSFQKFQVDREKFSHIPEYLLPFIQQYFGLCKDISMITHQFINNSLSKKLLFVDNQLSKSSVLHELSLLTCGPSNILLPPTVKRDIMHLLISLSQESLPIPLTLQHCDIPPKAKYRLLPSRIADISPPNSVLSHRLSSLIYSLKTHPKMSGDLYITLLCVFECNLKECDSVFSHISDIPVISSPAHDYLGKRRTSKIDSIPDVLPIQTWDFNPFFHEQGSHISPPLILSTGLSSSSFSFASRCISSFTFLFASPSPKLSSLFPSSLPSFSQPSHLLQVIDSASFRLPSAFCSLIGQLHDRIQHISGSMFHIPKEILSSIILSLSLPLFLIYKTFLLFHTHLSKGMVSLSHLAIVFQWFVSTCFGRASLTLLIEDICSSLSTHLIDKHNKQPYLRAISIIWIFFASVGFCTVFEGVYDGKKVKAPENNTFESIFRINPEYSHLIIELDQSKHMIEESIGICLHIRDSISKYFSKNIIHVKKDEIKEDKKTSEICDSSNVHQWMSSLSSSSSSSSSSQMYRISYLFPI